MQVNRAGAGAWALVTAMVLLPTTRAQGDVIDFFSGGPVSSEGTFLTSWGPSGLGFVTDGTSNTISFGETARLTLCFDGVSVAGGGSANPIADGTSNTIQLTE